MGKAKSKAKDPSTLQVEYLPLADLLPYAKNSRTHSDEQIAQIAASVKEFGFTNPILISPDRDIIAGHGRALAAAKLGMTSVPTIRLGHLTETQRKAYVIADNRLALNAGWDTRMLSLEMLDLKTAEFDLELLGFEEKELEKLLAPTVEETEGQTDPDDVPENAETRCKPGDLWILGKHRLLCGDSTNVQHVERLMGGQKATLCFTSPPYADQREYNGGKELSTEHLATFIRAAHGMCSLFAVNLGLSRKGGEINPYWDDYIKEAKGCGLKLLSWNVWDREDAGSIGNQTAMFAITHEWIFVFGSDRTDLNRTVPNKRAGTATVVTHRQADGSIKNAPRSTIRDFSQLRTVWRIPAEKARNHQFDHPAMFPVVLPEAYIEACTDPGQVVYEPFCGSGSTLIACEKAARRCFGMELDPKYCDVILARWEAFTGMKAELEARADG